MADDTVASLGFEISSKPLDDAKQKLAEVSTEAGKTGKAVDDFNQKVGKTGTEAAKAAEGVGKISPTMQTLEATTRRTGTSVEELQKRTAAFNKETERLATSAKSAGSALETTAKAATAAAPAIAATTAATSNVGTAAAAAAAGIKAKTAAVSDLDRAVLRMGPVLNQFSGGLGAVLGASNSLRFGLAGLAAVAGGAAVVGLAKISDDVARSKRTFDALTGSTKNGGAALEAVRSIAAKSGVDFDTMSTAVQKAAQGQALFADKNVIYANTADRAAKDAIKLADAFGTVGKILQTAGANAKEEGQVFAALGTSLQTTGTLTVEAFQKIRDISLPTARALSDAFGFKTIDEFQAKLGQTPLKMDELIQRLERIKPMVETAFNKQPIVTFEQSTEELNAEWDRLIKTLADTGAFSAVASVVGGLTNAVQGLAAAAKAAGNAMQVIKGGGQGGSSTASYDTMGNVTGAEPQVDLSGGGGSSGGYSGGGSSYTPMGGTEFLGMGPSYYGGSDPGSIDYGGGSTDYGYFADGGQFTVTGSGGTDSQTVSFKATPGEVVTISTPEDMAGGATGTIQGQSTTGPSATASVKEITEAIGESTIELSKKIIESSENIVSALNKVAGGGSGGGSTVNAATGLSASNASSSMASALDQIRAIKNGTFGSGGGGGGGGFSTRPSKPGTDYQKINNAKGGFASDPMYATATGPSMRWTPSGWSQVPIGQFSPKSSYSGGMDQWFDPMDYGGDYYGYDYGAGSTYSAYGDTPYGSNSYGSNYYSDYGGSTDSGITGFDPGVMDYGGGSYDAGYFATGGQFTVPGSPSSGTDKTLVQMHVTPGEEVFVVPNGGATPEAVKMSALPGMGASAASNTTNTSHTTKNITIHVASDIQAESFIRSRAQIARGF